MQTRLSVGDTGRICQDWRPLLSDLGPPSTSTELLLDARQLRCHILSAKRASDKLKRAVHPSASWWAGCAYLGSHAPVDALGALEEADAQQRAAQHLGCRHG